VSGEMVRLARAACAERKNVFIYQNNGMDLRVIREVVFDFAGKRISVCGFFGSKQTIVLA